MNVTTDGILRRKCSAALSRHRAAAKKVGQVLDYGLSDLVKLAQSTETCRYCRMPIAWDGDFDHVNPISRGGSYSLWNIAYVHRQCNQAKGMLNDYEFDSLLNCLREIQPVAMADVLRRLQSGGKRYKD